MAQCLDGVEVAVVAVPSAAIAEIAVWLAALHRLPRNCEVYVVTGIEWSMGAFSDGGPDEAVAGKIVFFTRRMERTREGSGYRPTVRARGAGPSAAAAKGAVGMLMRSAGTSTNRIAHTGGTRYKDDVPRIPAAGPLAGLSIPAQSGWASCSFQMPGGSAGARRLPRCNRPEDPP